MLLVEDDNMNATVIKTYLKDFVLVEHVFDGIEAINLCKEKKYDGVLMDINLKGINGIETMRQIRKVDEHYSNVPVIAITAYAMKGDKEKFLSEGFNYYLSKPFKRIELISLLSGVFN